MKLDEQINDPEQRYYELTTLKANQSYRVYISARTRAGPGKEYYIDVRTAEAEGMTSSLFMTEAHVI